MEARAFEIVKTDSRSAALMTATTYALVLAVLLAATFYVGFSWWLTLLHVVAVLSVLSAAWAYYGTVSERKLALLPHIVLQYVVCAALLVMLAAWLVVGACMADKMPEKLPETVEGYKILAAFFLFFLVAILLLLAFVLVADAAYAVRNFYDCLKQQPTDSDGDADNVV